MTYNKTSFRKHLIIAIAVILFCSSVRAAQFGIQADFLRNNTVLEANSVASNVFYLKNFSGKTVRFHLNYSVPAGWSTLGQTEKEYELATNDSVFIPIRIIPDKEIKGGTSYVVTIAIVSDKNVQFAAQNWYVSLPAQAKWSAHLPIKNQFFYNSHDSSGVLIYIKNEGNADEEIKLSLIPDHRLEVLKSNEGGAAILTFSVPLKPGTDTTLVFPVIRKPSLASNKGKDADLYRSSAKETYSMQIIAKSTTGNGSWSGTMQFTKATDQVKLNDFSRSAVPLTVEANVYDVLSSGTTMSVDAFGNTVFGTNRLLNYRFQSVFVTSYFNQDAFLSNNSYIGYFDDHLSVELGEVNGWGRSLLTGKGIKASYKYGMNTVGAMLTRSPSFFNNPQSEGYGFYHNLKMERFTLTSQYSHNTHSLLNLNSDVVNSVFNMKVNPRNQFTAGGGYSVEKSLFNQGTGYGYDLNYSFNYNKLSVNLGNTYGSPNYALARGIKIYTTRTNYSKDQATNYSFSTQNFSQLPSYFNNGQLILGNYSRSDRYEFRIGLNKISSSIAIKPTYLWEEYQGVRVSTKFVGLEYNAKNLSSVRFSLMGNFGYAKAVDFSTPDFFVARVGSYARWEKFYLSLRYTYGPTQLAEQIRFLNDHLNPQTAYLVASYDYWLKNGKLLLSTTGNLLYETYFKKINVRLRPELYYYAKSGIRFSFYASFFSTKQSANPMFEENPGREPFEPITNTEMNMGFGVRKQFGIPIPGKKFVSLHAVIFKDANGNHKQDDNEEGVENMLVTIKSKSFSEEVEDSSAMKTETSEEFVTNAKGELSFENIPPGVYTIKSVSLTPNGEWFDAGESEYTVTSKQKIFIPLTRGVRITGSVLVERDKYSNDGQELDLSRIRITAMDSTGKTYSVLTERNGSFMLNIPAGKYTLSINEGALGERFIFLQSKVELDLSHNFENFSITFNAEERKRKMEIKKFNSKEKDEN